MEGLTLDIWFQLSRSRQLLRKVSKIEGKKERLFLRSPGCDKRLSETASSKWLYTFSICSLLVLGDWGKEGHLSPNQSPEGTAGKVQVCHSGYRDSCSGAAYRESLTNATIKSASSSRSVGKCGVT